MWFLTTALNNTYSRTQIAFALGLQIFSIPILLFLASRIRETNYIQDGNTSLIQLIAAAVLTTKFVEQTVNPNYTEDDILKAEIAGQGSSSEIKEK